MGPIISDRFRISTDFFGLVIYILSFQAGSCSFSMKDQTISDISSQGLCSWGKQFSQLLTMSICFLLPSFEEYLSKKRFRCVLSTISLEERLSKSGKGVQFAFCKNFAAVMNFSGTIIRIF